MNPRRLPFLFLVFLLLAAPGCAPLTTTQTVTPAQTQPSTPVPAHPTPLPFVSTSTPLSTSTDTLKTAVPGQLHPILVFPPYDSSGGFLLGAVKDGLWLAADDAAALLPAQQTYALYSSQAHQGSAAGGEPVEEPICPSFWSVPIEYPAGLAAAVGADWDALPRIPQEVEINDPQAAQQVRDFLTAQGITQPEVKVQRILQVDLEGDGVQEFLVAASRFTEVTGHDVTPGDYSIILLYRAGQKALPVVSTWYTQAAPLSFPDRYGLSAVLDLNGDGRLEILVEITGWEKTGAQAYTLEGAAMQKVLQARCP